MDYDDRVSIRKSSTELDPGILTCMKCSKCETLPKYETHKEINKMLELHTCLKLPVMGLMSPENCDKFKKRGYPISIINEIGDYYFIKMGSNKLEKCEIDYYDKTSITPQERMIKNRRYFHEENTEKEKD